MELLIRTFYIYDTDGLGKFNVERVIFSIRKSTYFL